MVKRLIIYSMTLSILGAGLGIMGLATGCGGGTETVEFPSPGVVVVGGGTGTVTTPPPDPNPEPEPETSPVKPPAICLGEGAEAGEECGEILDADLSDGFLVDNSKTVENPDGSFENPFTTVEAALAAVITEDKAGGNRRSIYLARPKENPTPYGFSKDPDLGIEVRFYGGFYELAPGQYSRDLSLKTEIQTATSITLKNGKVPIVFDTMLLKVKKMSVLMGLFMQRTRLEPFPGTSEEILLGVSILLSKGHTLTIDQSEIVHPGGAAKAVALSVSVLGGASVVIKDSMIQSGNATTSSMGARLYKKPNSFYSNPVLDVVISDSHISSGNAPTSLGLLLGEIGNTAVANFGSGGTQIGAVTLQRNRISAGLASKDPSIGVGIYHATAPAVFRNNLVQGSGYSEAGVGSLGALGVVMRNSDVTLVNNTIRDAEKAVVLQRVQDEKVVLINNLLMSWTDGWGIWVDSTKTPGDPIDPKKFMIEEMRYNLFGKPDDGKNYTLYSHPGEAAPITCNTFDCLVPTAKLNTVATVKKVEGNIIADPMLADDGLIPLAGSPAINTGIVVSPFDGETFEDAAIDLLGNPRIHPWDIGAVEVQ